MSEKPPKVTVHSTESGEGQAKAVNGLPPGTAIDAKGRRITVKQLDPLQVYRLAKIMGIAADSDFARGYAALTACVRDIDGDAVPFPNSDMQLEATMQRLGSDGLDAVNKALVSATAADEKKPNHDAAKN